MYDEHELEVRKENWNLPEPPSWIETACHHAGPCAIRDAIERGDFAEAGREIAMMLPFGKLGKLGKVRGFR